MEEATVPRVSVPFLARQQLWGTPVRQPLWGATPLLCYTRRYLVERSKTSPINMGCNPRALVVYAAFFDDGAGIHPAVDAAHQAHPSRLLEDRSVQVDQKPSGADEPGVCETSRPVRDAALQERQDMHLLFADLGLAP